MQQTAYAKFVYERHSKRQGSSGRANRGNSVKYLLKEGCRKLIAFLFTQVGVCGLVVAYNIIGAYTFHAIEGVAGDNTPELKAEHSLNTSVTHMWNITHNLNVLNETKWKAEMMKTLDTYQHVLVPLIRHRGYRGVHPIDAWSPPACLMYSLSVYTTIGYGNLAPRTAAGKIVTILYAIVGMPLMLLYMANVGDVLAQVFKFVYFKACRCDIGSLGYYKTASGALVQVTRESRRQAAMERSLVIKETNFQHLRSSTRSRDGMVYKDVPHDPDNLQLSPPQNPPDTRTPDLGLGLIEEGRRELKSDEVSMHSLHEEEIRKTIPITWALLVLASYVISGGILFAHWEGWTVLDGCYFCYISLSTIGFGDLVPGRIVTGDDGNERQVESKQIICTVYLLIGMALVAMCFSLMQEEAIENLKTFWRSLGCLRIHVKRGRDRIRGKRRKSAIFKEEHILGLDLLEGERVREEILHNDTNRLKQTTDSSPILSSSKDYEEPGTGQSNPCDLNEKLSSDHSKSQMRKVLNEDNLDKKGSLSGNIELKFFKNPHDRTWQKAQVIHSAK